MSDLKTTTIQVRVTPAEQRRYSRIAKADGRTLSNWIRCQLNVVSYGR